MSDVIPDPQRPDAVGIDSNGDLVCGLWVGRMHEDGTPPTANEFEFSGWVKGVEFTREDH